MRATISHGALRAHRVGQLTSGLRGVCTSLPVFVVGLATWQPVLFMVILVAGIVMLAAGWATIRAIRELRMAKSETFELDTEAGILTRSVGELPVHRIARAKVKQLMTFPGLLAVYDGRRQMIIPSDAVGFDALLAELGRWGPITDRKSTLEIAGKQLAGGAVVKVAGLVLALVYFVWATGAWIGISIGVASGLVLSELIGRVLIKRSADWGS